ncbi:alpha/beta hydrolase [Frondihabitans sp. PAMC 28766]|uniref:alpha/beta hydrolase n=1 Tax=Frondihabitans sp. PAMC 28766 TaxID=1795630 RepID=UPI001EF504E3|nr:alpha/beta hydrolase fold domain-containing protein [Frondihabitans sp. PAMC 28766]
MSDTVLRVPPFDPELGAVLAAIGDAMPSTLTPEMIPAMRGGIPIPEVSDLLQGRAIEHDERSIPVEGGEVTLSIFRKADHVTGGPGIFHTHGGGMIIGDRFTGADEYLDWVEHFDAVVVSVEYRLAPEFPDPTPVNDSYAGLVWMSEHADELGFAPDKLVIAGASAGGGLAAGVSLKARDEHGPELAASLLIYPMIDDRNETVSSHQIDRIGVWDRGSNDTGWDALLGDRRKTDAVSIYAAPARATDLTGLPPTFVDCASAEVFRDEDVAYATRIWEQGGVAELHVWPGGFHGFDALSPQARLSLEARAARVAWLHRVLGV